MNELSTGLPSAWIDRLFQRFSVMYGKHWADQWEGVPLADVKDAWRTALDGCTGEQIAAGLAECGKFPPTMPEFVSRCRAPRIAAHQEFPKLAAPRREMPEHIREQLHAFIAKHTVA